MWYLILLLLSFLVDCAYCYSEELFLQGAVGMSLWNQGTSSVKKVWEPVV
jgi:hypothetical protein